MKKTILLIPILLFFAQLAFTQNEPSVFSLELSTQGLFEVDPSGFNQHFTEEKVFNSSVHLSAFWSLHGTRLDWSMGLGYANRDFIQNIFSNRNSPSPIQKLEKQYIRIRDVEYPIELRFRWLKKTKGIAPYTSFGILGSTPIGRGLLGKSNLAFRSTDWRIIWGMGCRISLFESWSLVLAAHGRMKDNFSNAPERFWPAQAVAESYLEEWTIKVGINKGF